MKTEIPLHEFLEDDVSSIPFKLVKLEEKTEYDTTVAHRHNYYEVFLFIKGGGYHQIDFNDIDIDAGSVHFLSPGQVHKLRRELGSYGYVMMFSRDFYYLNLENRETLYNMPFLNNNHWKPVLELDAKELQQFYSLFQVIEMEYQSDSVVKESVLRSYVNIILQKSKDIFHRQNPEVVNFNSAAGELVSSFKIALEENYRELHLVQEYAKKLKCTPEHLNHTLKTHLGKNASDLILSRIILEAKRLLMYSELSNKQIAYWLHYEDPSYFSRIFKRKTQLTPNQFREKHLERQNVPEM